MGYPRLANWNVNSTASDQIRGSFTMVTEDLSLWEAMLFACQNRIPFPFEPYHMDVILTDVRLDQTMHMPDLTMFGDDNKRYVPVQMEMRYEVSCDFIPAT